MLRSPGLGRYGERRAGDLGSGSQVLLSTLPGAKCGAWKSLLTSLDLSIFTYEMRAGPGHFCSLFQLWQAIILTSIPQDSGA